ncbi:NAD(P)-binding protein [Armillaria gallica]|uniref:NAD(P)-binding protein n=1 Tax=Armillaria gallica TaxID=47427 RepID=A0A2H3DD45_ARMGA|nr:NAD(P)-binding protein [Armillaria gallica]
MAAVMSLSGRVALVTGGGTGIGLNIAKTLAANGARVYITGRRMDVLEKAAASVTGVPGSILPLQMDVTDEEDVKAGAKHIENIDGKLDILVNNAGIAGSLQTVQNWADIFALSTIVPFFVIRVFQSLLIEGAHSRPQGTSSIINVSSVSATYNTQGPGTCMAYSVTKAALDKLTLVLGMSFAERGIPIRVNALQPGFFASQMVGPQVLEATKTKIPGFAAPVPVRRHGTEAEIGTAALFLAVSDYTNGALLSIEGGISLLNP